jgi:hypothetical protein
MDNVMITYNPDGGDLGRANIRPISALEMQLVIPHIASILEELAVAKISELPFKYAFEIHSNEKDGALFVIHASSYHLPSHVFWYECDGKMLFEMRGASGGIVGAYICYLVTK